MKGTKSHRERKNGASREQWEKRKAARNAHKVVVRENKPWPLNGREGYSPVT
jgi:hypothetical protein